MIGITLLKYPDSSVYEVTPETLAEYKGASDPQRAMRSGIGTGLLQFSFSRSSAVNGGCCGRSAAGVVSTDPPQIALYSPDLYAKPNPIWSSRPTC